MKLWMYFFGVAVCANLFAQTSYFSLKQDFDNIPATNIDTLASQLSAYSFSIDQECYSNLDPGTKQTMRGKFDLFESSGGKKLVRYRYGTDHAGKEDVLDRSDYNNSKIGFTWNYKFYPVDLSMNSNELSVQYGSTHQAYLTFRIISNQFLKQGSGGGAGKRRAAVLVEGILRTKKQADGTIVAIMRQSFEGWQVSGDNINNWETAVAVAEWTHNQYCKFSLR